MTKKGGRIATWRRRWFVLGGEKLEYFSDQDRKVTKGSVLLKEISEVGHILHETRNFCIGLRTDKRLYIVSCDDEPSFHQWLERFQEIQPKELDSEFTNVPHSSLGNIEKQWLSLVGKKKKNKDKETSSSGASKEAAKEEGSTGTPPSSSKDSKSSPTESVRNSLGANSSQDSPSGPASTRSTLTPRGNTENGETTKDSKPGLSSSGTEQTAEKDATASPASPEPQSTPNTDTTQPQGGFGALHNSFDLDFGMTINPALTASPLEESPFSETPDANAANNTISIPTMTPIVDTNSTAAEDTPFE